jgi:hypothetical protein
MVQAFDVVSIQYAFPATAVIVDPVSMVCQERPPAAAAAITPEARYGLSAITPLIHIPYNVLMLY